MSILYISSMVGFCRKFIATVFFYFVYLCKQQGNTISTVFTHALGGGAFGLLDFVLDRIPQTHLALELEQPYVESTSREKCSRVVFVIIDESTKFQ